MTWQSEFDEVYGVPRRYYTTKQVRAIDLMAGDIAYFGSEWVRVTELPERTLLAHTVRVMYDPDQPSRSANNRLCQDYELVTVQVEDAA